MGTSAASRASGRPSTRRPACSEHRPDGPDDIRYRLLPEEPGDFVDDRGEPHLAVAAELMIS